MSIVKFDDNRVLKVSTTKTGMQSQKLMPRSEFRKLFGLGNAEAKRKYRDYQNKFSSAGGAVFSSLVSNGTHGVTTVKVNGKGDRFTFTVAPLVEAKADARKPKAVSVESVKAALATGSVSKEELLALLA